MRKTNNKIDLSEMRQIDIDKLRDRLRINIQLMTELDYKIEQMQDEVDRLEQENEEMELDIEVWESFYKYRMEK